MLHSLRGNDCVILKKRFSLPSADAADHHASELGESRHTSVVPMLVRSFKTKLKPDRVPQHPEKHV